VDERRITVREAGDRWQAFVQAVHARAIPSHSSALPMKPTTRTDEVFHLA